MSGTRRSSSRSGGYSASLSIDDFETERESTQRRTYSKTNSYSVQDFSTHKGTHSDRSKRGHHRNYKEDQQAAWKKSPIVKTTYTNDSVEGQSRYSPRSSSASYEPPNDRRPKQDHAKKEHLTMSSQSKKDDSNKHFTNHKTTGNFSNSKHHETPRKSYEPTNDRRPKQDHARKEHLTMSSQSKINDSNKHFTNGKTTGNSSNRKHHETPRKSMIPETNFNYQSGSREKRTPLQTKKLTSDDCSYSTSKADDGFKGSSNQENTTNVKPVKVYTDNPFNISKDRVGKPVGTNVYHKKTGTVTYEEYKDNKQNRQLNRVGLPKGSQPQTKKSNITIMLKKVLNGEELEKDSLDGADYRPYQPIKEYVQSQANCLKNRDLEEDSWTLKYKAYPKTPPRIIHYTGPEIPFKELKCGKKIGEGGYGEVYFTIWKENVVAAKMMKLEKASPRRMKQFHEEIRKCCRLRHDNIVKFIGACLEQPCIVMEFMEMTLFDALHIKNIAFHEHKTISVIQQITNGLKYLHEMDMAHCDLKPQNILINLQSDGIYVTKISDFGLSIVKENSLFTIDAEIVKLVGTPRYSAPEVLRGESLGAAGMMTADIYSMSLVYFEIVFVEEPFYNLSYAQLQNHVGHRGAMPEISDDMQVKINVLQKIQEGCSFKPSKRPSCEDFAHFWRDVRCIYEN